MLTIKEFAQLCGCSTQTLRYYDRIDLLKPVKVDPWSGYRYFEESQAIDFVKIKNLQTAYFSIEEIKGLLTQTDDQVYSAFDRKIAEQEQKLERIRKIQKAYLTEKHNMETMIKDLCQYLVGQMRDAECMLEFGLNPADAQMIRERVQHYMESCLGKGIQDPKTVTIILEEEVFKGQDNPRFVFTLDEDNPPDTLLIGDENISRDDGFHSENYETLWEVSGWNHVHPFLDRIPPLEPGVDYCFWFRLNAGTYRSDLAFPLFMIGAMLLRGYGSETSMSCSVDQSEDGRNHFSLLRRKEE